MLLRLMGPFSSNTRIRFRCDASGNSDWVYIDDVTISGCNNAARVAPETVVENIEEVEVTAPVSDINLFPNPTSDMLTVQFDANQETEVQVFVTDFTGKVVSTMQMDVAQGRQQTELNVSNMPAGFYFVHMIAGKDRISKKFVVAR
jgi:acetaldehyde dehydrogenase (acetylating)